MHVSHDAAQLIRLCSHSQNVQKMMIGNDIDNGACMGKGGKSCISNIAFEKIRRLRNSHMMPLLQ